MAVSRFLDCTTYRMKNGHLESGGHFLGLQVFSGEKQQVAKGPLDCRGWRQNVF